MEIETNINCPGVRYPDKRLALVDLDKKDTVAQADSNKFLVRITMIGDCKNLVTTNNRCNLTNKSCIFRELPEIETYRFDEYEGDLID